MPLPIRTIQRVKDDAVKRVPSGQAAKLVAKGLYKYIDGGIDESKPPEKVVIQRPQRTYKETKETNSDIIQIHHADAKSTPLAPEQVRRERSPRTIRKKSDIPEEVLKQIKAVNAAGTPAMTTPGKGADALKNLIDRTRKTSRRTR